MAKLHLLYLKSPTIVEAEEEKEEIQAEAQEEAQVEIQKRIKAQKTIINRLQAHG